MLLVTPTSARCVNNIHSLVFELGSSRELRFLLTPLEIAKIVINDSPRTCAWYSPIPQSVERRALGPKKYGLNNIEKHLWLSARLPGFQQP